MKYYQVVCPAILAVVDQDREQCRKTMDEIRDFSKLVGVSDVIFTNHLFFGFYFDCFAVREGDLHTVDKTKWRAKKRGAVGYELIPRKMNKEFFNLYSSNVPKGKHSYDVLLNAILDEHYCSFTKGGIDIGYKKSKDEKTIAIIATKYDYAVKTGVKQISESEYYALKSEISSDKVAESA